MLGWIFQRMGGRQGRTASMFDFLPSYLKGEFILSRSEHYVQYNLQARDLALLSALFCSVLYDTAHRHRS